MRVLCPLLFLALALPALADPAPLTDDELASLVPESRRVAVKETLRLSGDRAAELSEALRKAPETRRDAMAFLVAYLPQADAAAMSAADLLENVELAAGAREATPWAREVPEDVWRAFVLPHRSAQEPFERWRAVFFRELLPRVKGLKSLREAALEVNRWAAENVTFQPTTSRDQGPLSTRRRGIGRCEEEMIFVIAALRSVGVPARPVWTPYWPFMDNNHAWVEAYADGGWHYLGGCEPAADLDQAWFTDACRRAGLVATMAYGVLEGPQVHRAGRNFTILNTTAVYGKTGRVHVKGLKPGANVYVSVFNFGGLRPLTRRVIGADGTVEFELGLGDYVVSAGEGEAFDARRVTVRAGETAEAALDPAKGGAFEAEFWLRYPPKPRPAPAAGGPADPERAALEGRIAALAGEVRDLKRRAAALEARAADAALAEMFEDREAASAIRVLADAAGNWKNLAGAFKRLDAAGRRDLLALLEDVPTKDRIEFAADALVEHATLARAARRFAADDAVWRAGVLEARIGDEPAVAWRARTLAFVSDLAREDATATARAVNEFLAERLDVRAADPLGNVFTAADVLALRGGTEADLALAAAGCLRALGVPARRAAAGPWAEFHDGKAWRPLFPKDPANLGNEKRDAAAASAYAERVALTVTFRRRGAATTDVQQGREYAVMAMRDGFAVDLDVHEDKTADAVCLHVPPQKLFLFAGTRNSNGDPLVRVFPLAMAPGKPQTLTIDLDLPADEVARDRRVDRALDTVPASAGTATDGTKIPLGPGSGSTVLFFLARPHEPCERMLPLVRDWAAHAGGVRLVAVMEGTGDPPEALTTVADKEGALAAAFRLPRGGDGTLSALPAVVWIRDGEIEMWEEGYELGIADVLEGTRARLAR
ncbi:MAG: transglutaminase domain-containing protein [Planctomycetes bacterium]|nr:transglutaminase domain-containing protein [Planctomycetota bacterium]